MHLRDPHLLGDLRLRQTLKEAELEDLALAFVQSLEARRKDRPILRDLVLVLFGAERFERVEVVVVASSAADRERERRVRAARLERLEHLLLLDAGGLGQLGDGG